MEQDPSALLRLFAAGGLGWVIQWALFGPKKIPSWVAWLVLGASTLLIYFWATPTAIADFQANWRYSIVGLITFFMTAKGTGSTTAAAKIAPKSNTL